MLVDISHIKLPASKQPAILNERNAVKHPNTPTGLPVGVELVVAIGVKRASYIPEDRWLTHPWKSCDA